MQLFFDSLDHHEKTPVSPVAPEVYDFYCPLNKPSNDTNDDISVCDIGDSPLSPASALLALLALVGTGVISLCLFRHKIDLKRQETTLPNNVMDDMNKQKDIMNKTESDEVPMPGGSPLSVHQLGDINTSNSTLSDGDDQNPTLTVSGHHSSENLTAEDSGSRQQEALPVEVSGASPTDPSRSSVLVEGKLFDRPSQKVMCTSPSGGPLVINNQDSSGKSKESTMDNGDSYRCFSPQNCIVC